VDYIEVKNGIINVGVGGQEINQLIHGGVLRLTPQIGANQTINWSCTAIDIENKFLPKECRQQ
ncbi:MAG: pilin, partial [Kangiellaceae bacterium]|nr:pilin [Kangiellaceae bacterium]